MTAIDDILAQMERSPENIRFSEACAVAEEFFGPPRIVGSHYIYKVMWPGDPRINLQKFGKNAKPYQIKQLLKAVARARSMTQSLEENSGQKSRKN